MVLVSVYFLLHDGGKKTPLRKLHGPLGIVWTKEESNGEREREILFIQFEWMHPMDAIQLLLVWHPFKSLEKIPKENTQLCVIIIHNTRSIHYIASIRFASHVFLIIFRRANERPLVIVITRWHSLANTNARQN